MVYSNGRVRNGFSDWFVWYVCCHFLKRDVSVCLCECGMFLCGCRLDGLVTVSYFYSNTHASKVVQLALVKQSPPQLELHCSEPRWALMVPLNESASYQGSVWVLRPP